MLERDSPVRASSCLRRMMVSALVVGAAISYLLEIQKADAFCTGTAAVSKNFPDRLTPDKALYQGLLRQTNLPKQTQGSHRKRPGT
ncbi:hypothetical protein [Comamonas aquatica]|jgi:hypothetical protein|uniref:hypothetical protein n=1 Tax=Comamonas aquatica TaxID=225991 RepID=UPI001EF2B32D|nr:hypothetical protein [Comamonas aquatica]